MKLRNLGVLGAAGLLAVTAAVPAFAQDKVLTIGVDLPLSGGDLVNGGPTLNGVQLAVDLANKAGGVGGYTLKVDAKDDTVSVKLRPLKKGEVQRKKPPGAAATPASTNKDEGRDDPDLKDSPFGKKAPPK